MTVKENLINKAQKVTDLTAIFGVIITVIIIAFASIVEEQKVYVPVLIIAYGLLFFWIRIKSKEISCPKCKAALSNPIMQSTRRFSKTDISYCPECSYNLNQKMNEKEL